MENGATNSPRRTTKDRIAFLLATWFGCGYVPRAPGTAGTLGTLPLYWLLVKLGRPAVVIGAAAVTLVGIWAASVVAHSLGKKDPQIVVIDESAGVLIALSVAPFTWAGVITAVVLFRLFDMTKPWPARLAERRLPGGWGIVMDDVVAGIFAALLLFAGRRFGLL